MCAKKHCITNNHGQLSAVLTSFYRHWKWQFSSSLHLSSQEKAAAWVQKSSERFKKCCCILFFLLSWCNAFNQTDEILSIISFTWVRRKTLETHYVNNSFRWDHDFPPSRQTSLDWLPPDLQWFSAAAAVFGLFHTGRWRNRLPRSDLKRGELGYSVNNDTILRTWMWDWLWSIIYHF